MRTQGTVTLIAAGFLLLTGFVVYRDLQRAREVRNAREQVLSSGTAALENVPHEESPFLENGPLPGRPEFALLEDSPDAEQELFIVQEATPTFSE